MKKLLERTLRFFATETLRMYRPKIVGITGSVGKTSAKEAVFAVLSAGHAVRKNLKNYNNELGVPLSILGAESAGRSFIGWFRVFLHAARLVLFRDPSYPDILVLEMGADRPGDIAYLTNFVPCDIGVVTAIGAAHTEYFGSVEGVQKEKQVLVTHLRPDGTAVLNADDARVRALRQKTKAVVVTYGFSEDALVRGSDIALSAGEEGEHRPRGLSLKLSYEGSVVPVFLPGVIGRHQGLAALAAAAVGLRFRMNLVDIGEALRSYQPPQGRMTLIDGIKQSLILDDSYNASPLASVAALETLRDLPGFSRRIACLGDMAELGAKSDEEHRQIGQFVASIQPALLITVGALGRKIADAAASSGLNRDCIASFEFSPQAGQSLQSELQGGELILIKGSQVSRMEKIVKEVMAEPEKASELLVRQGQEWKH